MAPLVIASCPFSLLPLLPISNMFSSQKLKMSIIHVTLLLHHPSMTFHCSEIKLTWLPMAHSIYPSIFTAFLIPTRFLCSKYISLLLVPSQVKFIRPQALWTCWSFLYCVQSPSLFQSQVVAYFHSITFQMISQIFFEGVILMTM